MLVDSSWQLHKTFSGIISTAVGLLP